MTKFLMLLFYVIDRLFLNLNKVLKTTLFDSALKFRNIF